MNTLLECDDSAVSAIHDFVQQSECGCTACSMRKNAMCKALGLLPSWLKLSWCCVFKLKHTDYPFSCGQGRCVMPLPFERLMLSELTHVEMHHTMKFKNANAAARSFHPDYVFCLCKAHICVVVTRQNSQVSMLCCCAPFCFSLHAKITCALILYQEENQTLNCFTWSIFCTWDFRAHCQFSICVPWSDVKATSG